jgi:hypothetical protein
MHRATRIILTVTGAFTALVPAIADLNASHLTNHVWPPHARYHGAIAVCMTLALPALPALRGNRPKGGCVSRGAPEDARGREQNAI